MSLERFCRKRVVTARPPESCAAVARRMRDEHVGAVVIATAGGEPIGIVTDRDLVVRLLAREADPSCAVGTLMTANPYVIRSDARIDEALVMMRSAGVRRLPIVDDNRRVVGMVSFDDLSVLLAGELGAQAAVVLDNRGP
jgi:CBS domain-containing protein